MYQGRLSDPECRSEGILDAEDADSAREHRRQGEIREEEMDG